MANVGASSRQNQTNIDDTQRNVVGSINPFSTIYPSRSRSSIKLSNNWFASLTAPKKKKRKRKR